MSILIEESKNNLINFVKKIDDFLYTFGNKIL